MGALNVMGRGLLSLSALLGLWVAVAAPFSTSNGAGGIVFVLSVGFLAILGSIDRAIESIDGSPAKTAEAIRAAAIAGRKNGGA